MSDSCWRTISTISCVCLPLRACFLVVFLQQWPKPGTGLMSLLLTGGGCNTSLGGLVRHTGRAAALIRIPVIPEIQQSESGERRNGSASLVNSSQPSLYVTRNSSWLVCVFFTSECRVNRTGSIEVLHRDGGHTAREDTSLLNSVFPTVTVRSQQTWEVGKYIWVNLENKHNTCSLWKTDDCHSHSQRSQLSKPNFTQRQKTETSKRDEVKEKINN